MSKLTTKAFTGFKYAYLVAFFALLSGIFYPLITDSNYALTIIGIVVLFVGLAGSIMVYKAATSEKRKGIFLGGGFALMIISLYYILVLTGRIA